jgi:ATP-binding cassette subfamily B protein
MTRSRYTDWALYRRLLGRMRQYKLHLLGIVLLGLMAAPFPLLLPLPLKIAVDALGDEPMPAFLARLVPEAVRNSTTSLLVLSAVLFVFIGLLNQVHALCNSLLTTYTGEKLVLDFRAELFRHVQRLSFSYHDTKGTTDTMYRIQIDASAVKSILLDAAVPLLSTVLTLGLTIYVAARIDWQLVLLMLAVGPVLFLVTRGFRARFRRQWSEVRVLESSAMSVVQEVVAANRVVSAFGQEDREHERYFRRSTAGLRAQLHAIFSQGLYNGILGVTFRGVGAVVLFVAACHVRDKTLGLGDLFLLMAYMMQMISPLRTIGKTIIDMQNALASAERAFCVLDQAPDVVDRSDARPIARAKGAVAFRDVCFAYNGGPEVLHDVSFTVPAGSRLGIMGRTGSGKTTLVTLLGRCFDPTAGQVLLDGVDLRDYKLADLRNQFATVLQDSVLFSTSIAENIAYGRPGARDEQIVAAAKAAGADEFISALPQGYDTVVGERGMTLSGGERQRIALARAFLKDAPILILDEPTSALDIATEAAIVEALERLMLGRTTFLISHRLSSLKNCDIQLEVCDGKVFGATAPTESADGRGEHSGRMPPVPTPIGEAF